MKNKVTMLILKDASERAVYRCVVDGALPAYKLEEIWRVKSSELKQWLYKNRNIGENYLG